MGIYDLMNMTGPKADRFLIVFGIASLVLAFIVKVVVTNVFNTYISYLLSLTLTIAVPFVIVTFVLFPLDNIITGFRSSTSQGIRSLLAALLFYVALTAVALFLSYLNKNKKRKR